METPENVNICWNDYESHLSSSVKDLRNDTSFCDVTLVCENTQVEAHKVILSSFSLFFSRILHENPHPHPLIYLRNVTVKNLMETLDYMYSGKVEVALGDVNSLLDLFKEFEIKGFDFQTPKTSPSKTQKRKSSQSTHSPPSKKDGSLFSWAPDMSLADFSHDEVKNQVTSSSATTWIDQDVLDDMLITSCDEDQSAQHNDDIGGSGDVSEIDLGTAPIEIELPESNRKKEIDALIVTGNHKKFQCRECPYTTNNIRLLKNHIEALHLPGIYICPRPSCGKIFQTNKARRNHVLLKHKSDI